MRVAVHAEQLLYSSPGGIGRYVANLLAGVPAAGNGDTVAPFVARHPRQEVNLAFARAGVADLAGATRVLPLPRPVLYEAWLGLNGPPLGWGAPELAAVDVVHAPSVAVPPSGRAPLVVTIHDAAPLLFPEAFPRRGLRFHRRGLDAAVRRAELIMTVSHAAADEIRAHLRIGAGRLRVVPGGADPRRVDGGWARAYRRSVGLDDRPYVLWVGSLEPRKNVATLLAAMAELRRRGEAGDAALVVAGFAGWLSGDTLSGADAAALGSSLVRLGQVSDDELWALYAGATVFAFPSLHEGFGLPVVEAMSQSVPVVCSDLPVLHEVAGPAARYAPARDPSAWAERLGELLADEAARGELGRAGLARSRSFTVGRQVAGTRAVYAEVAGR